MAAPGPAGEGPWTCCLAWPQCTELIKLIWILLSGCSAAAWAPQQQECLI